MSPKDFQFLFPDNKDQDQQLQNPPVVTETTPSPKSVRGKPSVLKQPQQRVTETFKSKNLGKRKRTPEKEAMSSGGKRPAPQIEGYSRHSGTPQYVALQDVIPSNRNYGSTSSGASSLSSTSTAQTSYRSHSPYDSIRRASEPVGSTSYGWGRPSPLPMQPPQYPLPSQSSGSQSVSYVDLLSLKLGSTKNSLMKQKVC